MVTLHVNGKAQQVDVPPDTPLLWVLRDVLGMTGTEFGCGMALCGACTVHLDGRPTRSCITPISATAQGKVTTIEAIGGGPVGKAGAAGGGRPRGPPSGPRPGGPSTCPPAPAPPKPHPTPTHPQP